MRVLAGPVDLTDLWTAPVQILLIFLAIGVAVAVTAAVLLAVVALVLHRRRPPLEDD